VSGTFLYLIAALNAVILWGTIKVLLEMRSGVYDERQLEEQLSSRGFMSRLFGRFLKAISKPWQMYPVGLLFGLGFDINTLGFIIVGLFLATWIVALSIWPFGRLEQRWDRRLPEREAA
jgi:high-affinity nickel permease